MKRGNYAKGYKILNLFKITDIFFLNVIFRPPKIKNVRGGEVAYSENSLNQASANSPQGLPPIFHSCTGTQHTKYCQRLLLCYRDRAEYLYNSQNLKYSLPGPSCRVYQ